MFDNFLRHKILGQILEYKNMFNFKKEMYVSLSNFHEFFPKEKNFDRAIINLFSKGYIAIKKEDEVKKINIEDAGVFAFSNNTLKKEEYKLWWAIIKDGGILIATILMAVVAIIALNKDTSKFAEKDKLNKLEEQLIMIKHKVQEFQIQDSVKYHQADSVSLSHDKNSSIFIDTAAIKDNQ